MTLLYDWARHLERSEILLLIALTERQRCPHCKFKPRSGVVTTRYAGQVAPSFLAMLSGEFLAHLQMTHGWTPETYAELIEIACEDERAEWLRMAVRVRRHDDQRAFNDRLS